MGDRPGAARRARRPSGLRRPRRRFHPRARPGAARARDRGAGRRGARGRPGRVGDRGGRPDQGRPSGDVRRRARRVPRRDGPGALPPAPSRPRQRPRRRADRGHRDPRVPAQRHPVRGLLRAGHVRRGPQGDLHRHAVGRPRPERDARAQPRLDQQHQHPRGVSGPPPPARRGAPEPVADPPADRRPRVRRGLGDVLRAADARARLRCRAALPRDAPHGRHLAGLPDHPRRAPAPRRAERRRGDRLHGRADQLRATQRAGRGQVVHVPPDLPDVVPARPDAPPPAARRRAGPPRTPTSRCGPSTTRCSGTARCRSASIVASSPARAARACW